MSAFVVLGSIGLTALLAVLEIPAGNRDMMIAMLGGFGPLSGVVVKYWLDNATRIFSMMQTPVVTTTTSTDQTTTETKTQ